jgi:hypothetical protein
MFFAHPEWKSGVVEYASDIRKSFNAENVFEIGIAPARNAQARPTLTFAGVKELHDVYLFLFSGDSIYTVETGKQYAVSSASDAVQYSTVFATSDKNFLSRVPLRFAVENPYPNPFHPTVNLRYTLPYRFESNGWLNRSPYEVKISLYNSQGRLVRTLVDRKQEPGMYRVVWDGKSNMGRIVSSGTYFSRIDAGKYNAVKKMVMVK